MQGGTDKGVNLFRGESVDKEHNFLAILNFHCDTEKFYFLTEIILTDSATGKWMCLMDR